MQVTQEWDTDNAQEFCHNQVSINSRHFETVTVITVTKTFEKNGSRDVQEPQHIPFISHLTLHLPTKIQ